jgi:hypothetical protein
MTKIELQVTIKKNGIYSKETLMFDNQEAYDSWANKCDDSEGKIIGVHLFIKRISKKKAKELWDSKIILIKTDKYDAPKQLNTGGNNSVLNHVPNGTLFYIEHK